MIEFNNGYFVKKCEKIKSLNSLRLQIFNLIKKEFNIESDDIENVLNNFHKHTNGISDTDFNEKRMLLMKNINDLKIKHLDLIAYYQSAFKKNIIIK